MGFMTLYAILTAIIIYGKITPITHGPLIIIGMQYNPNRERSLQELDHQLRILEITGWDRGGRYDRSDHVAEN
jgi:hypothetical protein